MQEYSALLPAIVGFFITSRVWVNYILLHIRCLSVNHRFQMEFFQYFFRYILLWCFGEFRRHCRHKLTTLPVCFKICHIHLLPNNNIIIYPSAYSFCYYLHSYILFDKCQFVTYGVIPTKVRKLS